MHHSSMEKMKEFKEKYFLKDQNLKILDVGAHDYTESYNYRNIFNEDNWEYHGLDLREGPNVDIIVENPYSWDEIEDNTYDVVISGQAFEHIEFFWLTLEEIGRVVKDNGFLCVIVPSQGPVHRNPVDCYRFSDNGVKAFAEYIGFNILEASTSSHSPWFDSYLVAKKFKKNIKLEDRMYNLEDKLEEIIELLQ